MLKEGSHEGRRKKAARMVVVVEVEDKEGVALMAARGPSYLRLRLPR